MNYETKRILQNLHYKKEITFIELSVYHNVFATASASNLVYIWDYEYFKLLGCVELPNSIEPTAISFINGYSIIVISCNNAKIYFIYMLIKNITTCEFTLIGVINLSNILT